MTDKEQDEARTKAEAEIARVKRWERQNRALVKLAKLPRYRLLAMARRERIVGQSTASFPWGKPARCMSSARLQMRIAGMVS